MIRHIAMFKFKDGVTQEQVDELTAALMALPPVITEIEAYACGPDLGLVDETWDYVVTADFATPDGYRVYADHPTHVEAAVNVAKPLMAASQRVQFEL